MFDLDLRGLGLSIEGLLSHIEVEMFEDPREDNITPFQRSLFNVAPRATIIFHLRTDMEDVDEFYDWTDRMDILADRVSTLFPLMLKLIEAGYMFWGH